MKRKLILLFMALLPMLANAYDAEIDGIYYNFSGNEAEVTNQKYPDSISEIRDYTGLVVIPEKVTYNGKIYSVTCIGHYAFYGCDGLTSITIPESVTSIGSCAFDGCSSLTSITIPNSVTSINSCTFQGCSSLASVTIGNGVTRIDDFVFNGCTGLTSITIPNSVTIINYGAFHGCTGLTSIIIPNSVTSIGEDAFYGCEGLTSINVEEGNAIYDSRDGCNAIIETATSTLICGCQNSVIPNGVISIGRSAFSHCSGLTSITIPNSVTSIGGSAFYYCTGLTSITIPNSVTSIGGSAFNGCIGLTSVTIPKSVTSISSYAFWNCRSLTSIIIPEGVTDIGSYAFQFCSSLTSITIPNSLTSIGDGAFSGCSSLSSITIPKSVTSIGDAALSGCFFTYDSFVNNSTITNENIWGATLCDKETIDGLLLKGSMVVRCRHWVTSITIPNSVTSIGYSAFSGCSSLTSITIPESVTSIGRFAFHYCTGLTSITIPKSVTDIGAEAFSGCSSLTSVTISNGVIRIGGEVFGDCIGLTSITIPNSVTSIGNYVFSGCSGLTSINVEEGNAIYDSRDGCNAIIKTAINTLICGCKNSVIPNSVTSIGEDAFFNCDGLTSITIPESVTSIGNHAFYECTGLASITIPGSVTSIGNGAFSGCSGLTSVTSYIIEPFPISSVFDSSTYNTAPLYVPADAIEAYQSTDGWKNFKNILPMTDLSMTAKVIVTATEGGNVSINGGEVISNGTQSYWIDCGTEVTFDFAAKENYYLQSVTVNGEDITDKIENGRFTIASLKADVTVIATFSPNVRYSVTASVVTLGGNGGSLDWVLGRRKNTEGSLDTLDHIIKGIGGTVTVADSIVISGQSTTVTITPNVGYELKSVTVNGEDKTTEVADSVLTLRNIQENKNVVVTFQKQRFSVTANECEGGSISLSATEVEWGDNVTVIVKADDEYEIASLIVADEDLTASVKGMKNVKCVINSVTKDIVVSATFKGMFASIELTSDGERTYCCDHALDFSQTTEIRAYIASGYYPQTGYVLLTRVLEVPARTGIVIRGEEGIYEIPFGKSSAYYLNLLVGNVEPQDISPIEGNYANFIPKMGNKGLGFYSFAMSSHTMEANSARLQLPLSLFNGDDPHEGSLVKIAYEEDADAVRAAIGTSDDAPVYDLSGRQIVNSKSLDSKLRRGIYIKNGKKVMIK